MAEINQIFGQEGNVKEAVRLGIQPGQKAAAADEIAYFELLFAKTIEIVGNINGQFSEGVSADSPCNACLYLADMYRDCGEKIAAAASNPGTSDVAPVIAIFAGISVLAAAAVVLKKKVA